MPTPIGRKNAGAWAPVAAAFGDAWLLVRTHQAAFFLLWLCFSVVPALLILGLSLGDATMGALVMMPVLEIAGTALGAVCLGALADRTRRGEPSGFTALVSQGMPRFGGFLVTLIAVYLRILLPPVLGSILFSAVLGVSGVSLEGLGLERLLLISMGFVLPLVAWGYMRYWLAPFFGLVTGERGLFSIRRSLLFFRAHRAQVAVLLALGTLLPGAALAAVQLLIRSEVLVTALYSAITVYAFFVLAVYVNYCFNALVESVAADAVPEAAPSADH
jgi:hypothetical protein